MEKKYTYASDRMRQTHQKYARQGIPTPTGDPRANRMPQSKLRKAVPENPDRVNPARVRRISQSASERLEKSHAARAHQAAANHEQTERKSEAPKNKPVQDVRSSQGPKAAAAKQAAPRPAVRKTPEAARQPRQEVRKAVPSVRRPEPQGRKLPKQKKKRSKRKLIILLPIAAVILILVLFLAIKVSMVKNHADSVKADFESMLEHLGDKDVEGAEEDLARSYQHCDALEASLTDSFWTAASKVAFVKKELDSGHKLLEVLHTAQDKLIAPLLSLMKEKPLSGLKVGDNGFNVRLINSYLDFVDSIHPELLSLTEQIKNIDTGSMTGGMLRKYKTKLLSYMETYSKASEFLPLIRAFLGNGEDKLYLLVAQNSAEIRASGGFPGSVGTIKITNGLLSIGDFKSVYKVLSGSVSYNSEVTAAEENLFGSWIEAPRDACFIPAFDRAAKIWAVGYEDYQRQNGALDHDVSAGTDDSDTGWDNDYPEEWYPEENIVTYDPSVYESRLAFYEAESGVATGNANESGEANAASSPDCNSNTDYEIGAYLNDGSVFYSYNNDFYGYGSNETEYVEYVDGVVSLTPAIIQMLLGEIGEITLSDGSVLDGYNATKVLQYDLYHKYFNEDTFSSKSNRKADKLFAETAKKVMKEFVSNVDISKFNEYYELFKKGAEDHIIMMWMKDAEQEAILDKIGLSGKLNENPDQPEAGVYFSLADPSKLGWYLNINTYLDEVPVINYDGSRTYDVTVKLTNIIDDQEISESGEYIIGSYNGGIRGYVHFFGPAGGTLSDFSVPDGMYIFEGTYKNLDVGYNLDLLIPPGESLEFSYKVTTAPFVETPPRIVTTPTLAEYR